MFNLFLPSQRDFRHVYAKNNFTPRTKEVHLTISFSPKKISQVLWLSFAVPTKIIIYIYLQEFGHHVRLATHANFRSFVESAGVDFYPLGGDPRVLAGCKRFFTSNFFQYLTKGGKMSG